MTSPEMVSEAELVAAAHAIHIAKHEGDTTRAEKTWRYVSRLRRAQAFAALAAAAQVRAQARIVPDHLSTIKHMERQRQAWIDSKEPDSAALGIRKGE